MLEITIEGALKRVVTWGGKDAALDVAARQNPPHTLASKGRERPTGVGSAPGLGCGEADDSVPAHVESGRRELAPLALRDQRQTEGIGRNLRSGGNQTDERPCTGGPMIRTAKVAQEPE